MKKSLLLSLIAFFAIESFADAPVSGSAGVTVGMQHFDKSKKILNDIRAKKANPFAFGIMAQINYDIMSKLYAGVSLGFNFMNKKVKFDMTEANLLSALETIANETVPESTAEQIKTSLKTNLTPAVTLFNNKSFISKRYRNMFTVIAHIGYRFTETIFAELGLGWARLNAKYKTISSPTVDDIKKYASVSIDELHTALFGTGIETKASSSKVPNMGNTLVKRLTDSSVNSKAKIKKNGLIINGLVGFNVTSCCAVSVSVNYVTSIKAYGANIGVSYKF